MSRRHSAVEPPAPTDLREESPVNTNWKALWAILGLAALAGGVYWKVQDHDRRLDKIEGKVDQVLQTTAAIQAQLGVRESKQVHGVVTTRE